MCETNCRNHQEEVEDGQTKPIQTKGTAHIQTGGGVAQGMGAMMHETKIGVTQERKTP
jgi:hypothetical protein